MIEAHPLAELFPLLEADELAGLAEDIREHGLREPIVIFEGKVIDGRNRFRALAELRRTEAHLGPGWGSRAGRVIADSDLNPTTAPTMLFRTFDGPDPLAFVMSTNLHRRHLSTSQRAMVAASIATMRQGERTDLPRAGEPSANLQKVAQAEAARLLSISPRSVADAKRVRDTGVPEVAKAVVSGSLAVTAAAKLAALPIDDQRAVLAEVARSPDTARAFRAVVREVRAEVQSAKAERRAAREVELSQRQAALPTGPFGVVLADPEWKFEAWSESTGSDRSAGNHYPTSGLEVIASRPVASIAADDAVLLLWATAPMLPQALEVMAAWGFGYRSHIVWAKDKAGTGYWARNRHELLLIGVRGKPPAPAMGAQPESIIFAPRGRHSEKPSFAHEFAEAHWPSFAKIELNARASRPGWTSWGLEAPAVGDVK